MTPKDLVFTACGCCNENVRAVVKNGNIETIVTDRGDGLYSVVSVREGFVVPGSIKTCGPTDEI